MSVMAFIDDEIRNDPQQSAEQQGEREAAHDAAEHQVVDGGMSRAEIQEQAPIAGYAHDPEPDPDNDAHEASGATGFNAVNVEVTRPVVNPDGDEVEKQTVTLDELPPQIAAKMHPKYPEKPIVQEQNEALTDATPTGYVHTGADEWKDAVDVVTGQAGQAEA